MSTLKIIRKDGHIVRIDADHFSLYQKHAWKIIHEGGDRYVLRKYFLSFHKLVLKSVKGFVIDHINRNPLDNRNCNLRLLTPAQNAFNTRPRATSKYSKYKGVSFCKDKSIKSVGKGKYWKAKISRGSLVRSKRFATELEAAQQYNEWAKELFGEFAYLNVLPESKSA
jgi:hypothetical protein